MTTEMFQPMNAMYMFFGKDGAHAGTRTAPVDATHITKARAWVQAGQGHVCVYPSKARDIDFTIRLGEYSRGITLEDALAWGDSIHVYYDWTLRTGADVFAHNSWKRCHQTPSTRWLMAAGFRKARTSDVCDVWERA